MSAMSVARGRGTTLETLTNQTLVRKTLRTPVSIPAGSGSRSPARAVGWSTRIGLRGHSISTIIQAEDTPVEFIGFLRGQWGKDLEVAGSNSQQKLPANLLAQLVALASGQSSDNPNPCLTILLHQ